MTVGHDGVHAHGDQHHRVSLRLGAATALNVGFAVVQVVVGLLIGSVVVLADAAHQAVEDLRDWPGERFGHRLLLTRAWELREHVRTWDALYVALAEALGATLLTFDERLARTAGSTCDVEVPGRY